MTVGGPSVVPIVSIIGEGPPPDRLRGSISAFQENSNPMCLDNRYTGGILHSDAGNRDLRASKWNKTMARPELLECFAIQGVKLLLETYGEFALKDDEGRN